MTVRFVQKNETLESIAEFYNLPSSKLERVNNLDDSTALEEGDVIYVPKTAKKLNPFGPKHNEDSYKNNTQKHIQCRR